MKYEILEAIVKEYANELREGAGYQGSGSWSDGGASSVLSDFKNFTQTLIVKYDLRPSEYDTVLPNVEVGEPTQFQRAIERIGENR